jgi:type II secretory pathway component PulF
MDLREFAFKYKLSAYFKVPDQLEFVEQFNSYMTAGKGSISVKSALEKVGTTYSEIYGDSHVVVEVCRRLVHAMKIGDGYDELMKEYFHPNIAIGYELAQRISTNKEDVQSIANLVSIERNIVKEGWSSIGFPLVFVILGLSTMAIVGLFVLPIFTKNGAKVTWTFEMTAAKFVSDFIISFWPLVITFIVGGMAAFKMSQPTWIGGYREVADNIWPYSLYRVFWSIRIIRLLGLLKKAKMRDLDALYIIRKYGSPYINHYLDEMIRHAKIGTNKKDYFGKGLLEKSQLVRLETYLNLSDSDFADGLLEVSEQAVNDVRATYKRVIARWSLILLLIGFGLMVLGVGAVLDGTVTLINK